MSTKQTVASPTRAVVTVSEMARMVGMSRTHFHSLVRAGVMPSPTYCPRTRRPLYTRELQQQSIAVRETNISVGGQFVIFYAARKPRDVKAAEARQQRPEPHGAILEGLKALGSTATTDQIAAAVKVCFPDGFAGHDEGTVIRAVWSHLRRPIAD